MSRRAGLLLAIAAMSCTDIVAVPRSQAPRNTCSSRSQCDAYPRQSGDVTCNTGRCEVASASGRPAYPFWLVVHIPDDLSTAPGATVALAADETGAPAFTESTNTNPNRKCTPPKCIPIAVAAVQSQYVVSVDASRSVGFPLAKDTTIPLRVVYEPSLLSAVPALPLAPLMATSNRPNGLAQRYVPFGSYRRVFYPQPPFDAFFPPQIDANDVEIAAGVFVGNFTLDKIDSPAPEAKVSREDGLDGWRLWLADRPTQRRISAVRTLSGTVASGVQLFTTGQPLASGVDRIEAVVAPPSSYVGVPRFVTLLFSGQGLGTLDYPKTPPPAVVGGVVAERSSDGTLLGFESTVRFESRTLSTMATGRTSLLQYETTVHTDERGRFATVLPLGEYVAFIDPAEGTGYASARIEDVLVERAVTALTLSAPKRTLVYGRALLTDGRPVSEADVYAQPYTGSASVGTDAIAAPRPGRARTGEDGTFTFELDEGPYVVTVVPKAGSGFPRVVVRTVVPSSRKTATAEVPEVRVPPPSRLEVRFRDSSGTENVIRNALVRAFARPVGDEGQGAQTLDPVEIGSAMTNADGEVELLLPPQPR